MAEKETVYLLGAGFNQCIEDRDGLKPPLATNFFQTLFSKRKYQNEIILKPLNPLFEYIEKYWKKTKDDLQSQPFDLEECFTLLQLHWIEAARDENQEKYAEATNAFSLLTRLVSEVLTEFNDVSFFRGNDFLTPFGKKVYEERPNIITFNYDTFLEKAIERASGVRAPANIHSLDISGEEEEVSYEELASSSSNWNCALGYGFKFHEVQLQRPGIRTPVDGERFYGHPENKLYNWKILKLHGSLNWFHYLPHNIFSTSPEKARELPPEMQDKIVLRHQTLYIGSPLIDTRTGWFINPLIIPLVLYKESMYQTELFSDLWKQARDVLAKCKRLIVIGYSFPPTDFAVKKLFWEAFENNKLEELIVVNPDTSVVKTIKELTHFFKPVSVCSNLREFLQ